VLVLELFDGIPLENRPPTSMLETVDVFTKAAHALETLHQLGYIHCDIKPNNILVGPNGDVKIIDFGQACKAGTIKERIQGTPDYIAPEQVRREPVSIRTDIFCLGATMYWTLCGKKIPTLFTLKKSENSFLVDNKIATPREFNSKVPENISNLVMDCVRTAPSKRPVNMGEVAGRLEIMHHGLAAQQCKAASNATAGTL